MKELTPNLLPSKNIASWISSIPPFGAFFGSLVAFPLMHSVGRKHTVLLTSPTWVIAWFMISTCEHWTVLLIGRMLSGFAAGLTIPSAQIYVSECCDPKIRGVLGSLPAFGMSTGILITYIAGKYVVWQTLGWMCCSITSLLFFAVILLPESPVWLKTKKRFKDAERSANWLHLEGFERHHLEMIEQKKIESNMP
jgi:MFS family permease